MSPILPLCLLALGAGAFALGRPAGFGAVGLDVVIPSGGLYEGYYYRQVPVEPSFRAGVMVGRGFAVGAGITLVNTFPFVEHVNLFTNTPAFSLGPELSWYLPAPGPLVRSYVRTGLGYYHLAPHYNGRRFGLAAGYYLELPGGLPISHGLEAGWYHDRVEFKLLGVRQTGNVLYLGLRLAGFD